MAVGEIGRRDEVHLHRRRAVRDPALLHLPQPRRRGLGDRAARDEIRQQVGMLGRRGVDDQPLPEQHRMPPAIVDDLQHAGAPAEVDDLNDVGEG